jgi:hypothetical protein
MSEICPGFRRGCYKKYRQATRHVTAMGQAGRCKSRPLCGGRGSNHGEWLCLARGEHVSATPLPPSLIRFEIVAPWYRKITKLGQSLISARIQRRPITASLAHSQHRPRRSLFTPIAGPTRPPLRWLGPPPTLAVCLCLLRL